MSFSQRCIDPCGRASQVAEFLHQASSLNIPVIDASGIALMQITWVLEVLRVKPTCIAQLLSLLAFSSRWKRVVQRAALPSAKSRSSSLEMSVHRMPLGSISHWPTHYPINKATKKIIWGMTHPCRTPVSAENQSGRSSSTMTLHLNCVYDNTSVWASLEDSKTGGPYCMHVIPKLEAFKEFRQNQTKILRSWCLVCSN